MPPGIPSVLVLVLLSVSQAEKDTDRKSRAGSMAWFQGEPTCAGRPKGTACWRELSHQPGCHVWTSNLRPDATVSWTAECAEGMAQGTGTLKWAWDRDQESIDTTGRLRAGKRHGPWVERWADGGVGEGLYVEGKRHGMWVIRDANGIVNQGSYLEGKQHGKWVARRDGRVVAEAHFVEGKGQWVDK